jgi:O-antigen/teichoic acid export membrane protein
MAFSTTKNWNEGTISKLAMFFAFIFVAIGVVAGSVLERIKTFRPLAMKVQTVPRFISRLKERIA